MDEKMMNTAEVEQVRFWVWQNLIEAIDSDYVDRMINNEIFIGDVCADIELTSGWSEEGLFNESDVRMALGRVLCDYLGIDY